MAGLKLGKLPHVEDKRDLRFSNFLTELPSPPHRFGHGLLFHRGTEWQMLGNGPDDSVEPGFGGAGDCVFAGADHETMLWTHLGGHPATFTGKQAIEDYSAVTGYVIGDDSTDQGTYVRDALKYRRETGVVDVDGNRHKIGAYAALRPGDWDELMQAAYIFGAVGIGIEFPGTAMEQFDNGQIWDVVQGAGIEGGHYVVVTGRNGRTSAGVLTWGVRHGMTRDFYETYCDEAWAILSEEELRSGKNERGFDFAGLQQALQQLAA